MNVVVVAEDLRTDEHLVVPILSALLNRAVEQLGLPVHPQVRAGRSRRIRGLAHLLDWSDRLCLVVDEYRLADLYVVVADRDGIVNEQRRADELGRLEQAAARHFEAQGLHGRALWGIAAVEETEVWALAGQSDVQDVLGLTWDQIRAEPHPKELCFLPYARAHGLLTSPFQGRKLLAEQAAQRIDRVCTLCPELAALGECISRWWQTTR